MDYYEGYETVKQKLIIAGISEIEEHGISDFSLRRVATSCNVSCAAPYKHFESKEDFIAQIVLYIHNKWMMLRDQVASIFEGDIKKQLTEICVAYVKFWIANPNFRAVLMLRTDSLANKHMNSMTEITESTKELIHKCCTEYGIDEDGEKRKTYVIRSLIYGATIMIDAGELANDADTIEMIRECINEQFQK